MYRNGLPMVPHCNEQTPRQRYLLDFSSACPAHRPKRVRIPATSDLPEALHQEQHSHPMRLTPWPAHLGLHLGLGEVVTSFLSRFQTASVSLSQRIQVITHEQWSLCGSAHSDARPRALPIPARGAIRAGVGLADPSAERGHLFTGLEHAFAIAKRLVEHPPPDSFCRDEPATPLRAGLRRRRFPSSYGRRRPARPLRVGGRRWRSQCRL